MTIEILKQANELQNQYEKASEEINKWQTAIKLDEVDIYVRDENNSYNSVLVPNEIFTVLRNLSLQYWQQIRYEAQLKFDNLKTEL